MHFDSETKNDEIAVDVPLPEEPTEMSGESGQGWITEEAFFTVSPGARQVRQRKEVKMTTCHLQKNVSSWRACRLSGRPCSRVKLSPEETVQARARWPDRAMDTRWVRTWKSDESRTSGRRAKARLIIKGFTDPDLLNIESHSSALTRDSLTVCVQLWTQATIRVRAADVEDWGPDQERTTTLRQNAARWNPRRIA